MPSRSRLARPNETRQGHNQEALDWLGESGKAPALLPLMIGQQLSSSSPVILARLGRSSAGSVTEVVVNRSVRGIPFPDDLGKSFGMLILGVAMGGLGSGRRWQARQ